MDWIELKGKRPHDKDLPQRAFDLIALQSVLEGRQYDVLKHPFSRERTDGVSGEYIPMYQRRPSVKSGLCRQVVDDATSLLFSEGHWPTIKASSEETEQSLIALVAQTKLNAVMMQAATWGSVGSVAVRMRVLQNRVHFDCLRTAFLTPAWDAEQPDRLKRVTERYKVDAGDLAAQGYDVQPDAGPHWFMRVWDDQAETWFLPWSVEKAKQSAAFQPIVDELRTVHHDLGFVPIEWVRNLTVCGGAETDGESTFETGIDTVIEADYLISQAGRALRYQGDPTLILKDPNAGSKKASAAHVGGAATALMLSTEGDAKLLELNGSAASATLKHYQQLRESALEVMHGNRSHGDNLSAAQSGRAMEMMCQGLIWLADRMRLSYGEGALLGLLRMVCAASEKLPGGILVGKVRMKDLDAADLSLRWAPWFMPTFADMQTLGQAVSALLPIGAISREAAVTMSIPATGIQDVKAELGLIETDIADTDKRAMALKAMSTAATETTA